MKFEEETRCRIICVQYWSFVEELGIQISGQHGVIKHIVLSSRVYAVL